MTTDDGRVEAKFKVTNWFNSGWVWMIWNLQFQKKLLQQFDMAIQSGDLCIGIVKMVDNNPKIIKIDNLLVIEWVSNSLKDLFMLFYT